MRDKQPNGRTSKIELISQWKLEAEFRNNPIRAPPPKLTPSEKGASNRVNTVDEYRYYTRRPLLGDL